MTGRGKPNPRKRNGWRRQQIRARVQAAYASCYICGRPIDYDLKSPDPMSFVVDETIPLARGGQLTFANSGAAHRWCNRIKGTHTLEWARNEVARQLNEHDGTPPIKPSAKPFRTSGW